MQQRYAISFLYLVCVFTLGHANADEETGDSECPKEIVIGERLSLVTLIDRLETCHFVFTAVGKSSEQCCYFQKGRDEDCTDKLTKPNGKECLQEGEYNVTNDGRGTGTCSLTIDNVSEATAGNYKSYTDRQLIQECTVELAGALDPVLIGIVLALGSIILVAILLAAVYVHLHKKTRPNSARYQSAESDEKIEI